ncbi:aquaporin-like protein [Ascobolus immersus RN42]|uniref:Aquaporin-like protein n=1 Tax=Ascobolus immersus RN42 TaxID=1160509 RepID=A0A3N4I461_ASCIM|nr:aquaporin-like protein [Ascobolus immersus RN42]
MKFVSTSKELDPIKVLFIGFSFGFSLLINVWIFYRITGGLFNPALTWGMVLVGGMPWVKGIIMFIAQIIGGIVAAAGADAVLPGKLDVSCGLAEGVSRGRGLMLECLLTAELMLAVLFLAVEKHRATPFAPLVIGFTIAILHFIAVPFTGASLNPARAFGPAVVEGTFNNKHWVFWLGPLMGTTFAAGFYMILKALNYRTLNPSQDQIYDSSLQGGSADALLHDRHDPDRENMTLGGQRLASVSDTGSPIIDTQRPVV